MFLSCPPRQLQQDGTISDINLPNLTILTHGVLTSPCTTIVSNQQQPVLNHQGKYVLPISAPGPAYGCPSVTRCTTANCNTSQLHHLRFCSNSKNHFSPKSTNILIEPHQFSDCWQDGWICACPVHSTRTAFDLHMEDSLLIHQKLPKERNKRNWSHVLILPSKCRGWPS